MDFSKYKKTEAEHVVRIRRSDMAVMRLALEAAGDAGASVRAYSDRLPLELRKQLPAGTDRRHAVVTAHYPTGDILTILEEAKTDPSILDKKAGQARIAQEDYDQNRSWLDGTLPVGVPAGKE